MGLRILILRSLASVGDRTAPVSGVAADRPEEFIRAELEGTLGLVVFAV